MAMSELIAVGFKGESAADEVLIDLEKMEQIHKIHLDDAVIAVRRTDGTVKIKHSNILVMSDAALGSVFGMVLGGPAGLLVGGLVGAAIGESVKVLAHVGIDDPFVEEVAEIMEPGNSAIFFRVHKHISNDIVGELEKYDGKLLRSSLTIRDGDELMKVLEDHVLLKDRPGTNS
jgi:uncharacterized membrane protein